MSLVGFLPINFLPPPAECWCMGLKKCTEAKEFSFCPEKRKNAGAISMFFFFLQERE